MTGYRDGNPDTPKDVERNVRQHVDSLKAKYRDLHARTPEEHGAKRTEHLKLEIQRLVQYPGMTRDLRHGKDLRNDKRLKTQQDAQLRNLADAFKRQHGVCGLFELETHLAEVGTMAEGTVIPNRMQPVPDDGHPGRIHWENLWEFAHENHFPVPWEAYCSP